MNAMYALKRYGNADLFQALIPYVCILWPPFPTRQFTCLTAVSQLESYYDLTYTVVSLVFLSPFLGYSVAALLNNSIHMNFGQRGIAILAPGCRLVTYVIFSLHPPYPVLVVAFAVTGFGNGMIAMPSHDVCNF